MGRAVQSRTVCFLRFTRRNVHVILHKMLVVSLRFQTLELCRLANKLHVPVISGRIGLTRLCQKHNKNALVSSE